MRKNSLCVLALITAFAIPSLGRAQGHGPIFGLSTPTLGKGGWSLDATAMGRTLKEQQTAMIRTLLSYGINEDLQVSASLPMPIYATQGVVPARVSTRMPSSPDIEFTLGWRFQRRELGIGKRFESTAYLAFDYPTDPLRVGLRTSPGFAGAVATGYASRVIYVWAGTLYRRYVTPIGPTADHLGDLAMYSLVVGYRPPPFQHDYPQPDWRLFVEAVGETTAQDVAAGVERPNSGGDQLFVGPTLLGLYGGWGVSGGPIFPVYRRVNGTQPREKVRMSVNFVRWF
ncbi:MAG: hypothetical protein ACREOG_06000 [Gemmatimonadaceae bacterium]